MIMRILIDSYDTFAQNPAGGVNTRFFSLLKAIRCLDSSIDIQLFDKFKHKIKDFDIVHLMKASFGKYDLVQYAHANGIPIVISTVIPLSNGNKTKFILDVEKIFPLHSPHFFIKKMLEFSSRLITESNEEKRFINRTYGIDTAKMITIQNGVELPVCNNKNLFLSEYNITRPYVLSVGRVDPNKNQLTLIRALKGTNVPLVIIGGPDSSCVNYFEQCKQEADENVIFTGWVDHKSELLTSAYMNAKVIALPSYNETYGLAVAEGGCYSNIAISEGLPIIDMLPREQIYTFMPQSVDGMRKAILKAYNDPYNISSQEYCRNYFSWDLVAKQHVELYHSIKF